MKLESSRQIFEKYISHFMTIRSVGAQSFHAGGRTDGRTDWRADTIPVPDIFGRLTLDFRESKCFLRWPETLVEMKEQLQKEFLVI